MTISHRIQRALVAATIGLLTSLALVTTPATATARPATVQSQPARPAIVTSPCNNSNYQVFISSNGAPNGGYCYDGEGSIGLNYNGDSLSAGLNDGVIYYGDNCDQSHTFGHYEFFSFGGDVNLCTLTIYSVGSRVRKR